MEKAKPYMPEFCSRCGRANPMFVVQLPIASNAYPDALSSYSLEGFCHSCAAEIREFALTPPDK